MKHTTKETWEQDVLNGGLVLVDFWAGWCQPCLNMMPVLEKLEEQVARLTVAKVNGDEQEELMHEFNVQGLPTLILFKDGEQVWTLLGAKPFAMLVEKISPYL